MTGENTKLLLFVLSVALSTFNVSISKAEVLSGVTGEIENISGPSVVFASWAGGTANFETLIDGGTGGTTSDVNWCQASTNVTPLPHLLTFELDDQYDITSANFFNDFGEAGEGVNEAVLTFYSGETVVGTTTVNLLNQTDSANSGQSFPANFLNVDKIEISINSTHGTLASSSGGGTDTYQIQEINFTVDSAPIPLDLYILAGQSNASGRVDTGATGSNYSAIPAVDDDILYYYRADGPSSNDVTSGGNFLTLAPLSSGYIGPEITMMRELHANSANKIALIKVSDGGTSLGVNWNSSTNGNMWANWVADTTDAINDLDNLGYVPTLKGILWLQGEADANDSSLSNNYQVNYTALTADMVSHIDALGVDVTDTLFITALIRDSRTYAPAVRTAQINVMNSNTNWFYFDTDDLTTSDGVHYDEPSTFTVGERFATYLLSTPTIEYSLTTGNEAQISFSGVLYSSPDLSTWTPLSPQPATPYSITQSETKLFFRTERE